MHFYVCTYWNRIYSWPTQRYMTWLAFFFLFLFLASLTGKMHILYLKEQHRITIAPLLPPTQFTPLFLFRKGQVSHEYQQNMAYKTAVKLSTSSCVKAKQGDPVWRVASRKPVKESETAPVPTVRSPRRGPSYTTVTYMQRAEVSPLQTPWLLVQSLWDPMNPG